MESGAEALAEAAAETPQDPTTESLPLPEAAPEEEFQPEEPVAEQPQEEEVVPTLEEAVEPPQATNELPADETMLDMGKMNRPRLNRGTGRRPAPLPKLPPAAPPPEPEVESTEEQGGDEPKKKGFFGRMFGKKK